MLTNKEIKALIKQNHGDQLKFCAFLGVTPDVMRQRLSSKKEENNLFGKYVEFLINEKRKEK